MYISRTNVSREKECLCFARNRTFELEINVIEVLSVQLSAMIIIMILFFGLYITLPFC